MTRSHIRLVYDEVINLTHHIVVGAGIMTIISMILASYDPDFNLDVALGFIVIGMMLGAAEYAVNTIRTLYHRWRATKS